jgi:hypothetical protein
MSSSKNSTDLALEELRYRLAGLEAAIEHLRDTRIPVLESRLTRLETGMLAWYRGDRETFENVMRRKTR